MRDAGPIVTPIRHNPETMATTSQRPAVVLMAKGIKFRELAKKASFEFFRVSTQLMLSERLSNTLAMRQSKF